MISYRQADLLDKMVISTHCKISVYFAKDGIYFYDIDPEGYAFDKTKPLQDAIDNWFENEWADQCEKVAVGWRQDPGGENNIKVALIDFLKRDKKVKNLEVREKDSLNLHIIFSYIS